ncbi:MAG: hypothetical protein NTY48_04505 [Candidatus Diapherotrites archaeon]|nr:hypothetical protein [Candidatus Diapherotrites archaeon]
MADANLVNNSSSKSPSVPIKQIDILVYPFYAHGIELETPVGEKKCRQWIKQMGFAAKNQDTAFVVIHMSPPKLTNMQTSVTKQLFQDFFEAFKALNKIGLVYNTYSGQDLQNAWGIFHKFYKKGFAPNLIIRAYGIHSRACVKVGVRTGAYLQRLLLPYDIKCHVGEQRGLCVKEREFDLKLMLPRSVSPEEAAAFVEGVRKGEVSVFAARKPQKVREFLDKRKKH